MLIKLIVKYAIDYREGFCRSENRNDDTSKALKSDSGHAELKTVRNKNWKL